MKPIPEVHVVTGVPVSDQPARKNRYMVMMLLRALMVPGVLFLPIPPVAQAALVCVTAVLQLVAVIMANEPTQQGYNNPSAYHPIERLPENPTEQRLALQYAQE